MTDTVSENVVNAKAIHDFPGSIFKICFVPRHNALLICSHVNRIDISSKKYADYVIPITEARMCIYDLDKSKISKNIDLQVVNQSGNVCLATKTIGLPLNGKHAVFSVIEYNDEIENRAIGTVSIVVYDMDNGKLRTHNLMVDRNDRKPIEYVQPDVRNRYPSLEMSSCCSRCRLGHLQCTNGVRFVYITA